MQCGSSCSGMMSATSCQSSGRRCGSVKVTVRVVARMEQGTRIVAWNTAQRSGAAAQLGRTGRRGDHQIAAVHVKAGVLFLPLGAPVLEPDFHLET